MLFLLPLALAAPLDFSVVDSMQKELVPELEELSGRSFYVPPELVVVNGEQALERWSHYPASWVDPENISYLSRSVMGMYTPFDQRVYILKDHLEAVYRRYTIADDLRVPFLRCVVAHELVHALQHQLLERPQENQEIWETLLEGHAALMGRRLCGDAKAVALSKVLDASDSVSSLPFSPGSYAWGSRFLERVQRSGGSEALWQIFQQVPSKEEFIAATREVRMLGWDSPELLVRAAQRLHDRNNPFPGLRSTSGGTSTSPTQLMTRLEGGEINAAHIYPSEAGLFAQVSSNSTQVAIAAFRLEDPEDAQRWLTQRQALIREGNARVMTDQLGGVYGSEARPAPGLLRWGAQQSLGVLIYDRSARYLELWGGKNGVLVGVAAYGADPKQKDLQDEVETLLTTLPAEVPTILAYEGALPPAARSLSGDFLLARALRFQVDNPAGCVTAITTLGGDPALCAVEIGGKKE